MKTVVITLQQQQERLKYIENEIKRCQLTNYDIITGVYGAHVKVTPVIQGRISKFTYSDGKERFYDSRLRLNGQGLKKGEIGCALSHLTLYEKLIQDKDNDVYLILEDDVHFIVPPKELHKYLNNLPSLDTFDLCHIFLSDWYPFAKIQKISDYYWIPAKKFFNRTGAYIVTKSGAKKLLNSAYPCMGLPSDDLISSTFLFSNDFRLIVSDKILAKPMGFTSSICSINKIV